MVPDKVRTDWVGGSHFRTVAVIVNSKCRLVIGMNEKINCEKDVTHTLFCAIINTNQENVKKCVVLTKTQMSQI